MLSDDALRRESLGVGDRAVGLHGCDDLASMTSAPGPPDGLGADPSSPHSGWPHRAPRALEYRHCNKVNATWRRASVTAFSVGRSRPDGRLAYPRHWAGWVKFSYPFRFAGPPAVSVPCGVDTTGLTVDCRSLAAALTAPPYCNYWQ